MQRIWPSCAGLPSGLVIVRRISIAMAAENGVVVAEVQAKASPPTLFERRLGETPRGAPALSTATDRKLERRAGRQVLHRHWPRASNNVPDFLETSTRDHIVKEVHEGLTS